MAWGQPGERERLEFPKQDQVFADELCYAVQTIKLFTAVVGIAERGTKTFWLSSAASSRSPGNQPLSLTCFPSQKGNGKGLLCHPPSCSTIPKHLVALPLMFKITFPCVALQTLITGHRDSSSQAGFLFMYTFSF